MRLYFELLSQKHGLGTFRVNSLESSRGREVLVEDNIKRDYWYNHKRTNPEVLTLCGPC